MRITGYKNDNGWSAERGNNSDLFFLNGPDNESKALVPESFFAGSDWVAVKEEEWAKGEWVYVKDGSLEELFRLGCIAGDNIYEGGEYYLLVNGEYRAPQNPTLKLVCDKKEASKATYDQIERIFKAVLQHKGYVSGSWIIAEETGSKQKLEGNIFYNPDFDAVYFGDWRVYSKGTWAKIVEETKKEYWRTKPVFSYEDIEIEALEYSQRIVIGGKGFLLVPIKELKEEAKRRTV